MLCSSAVFRCFVLLVLVPALVFSLNEALRGQSILYGIASIAQEKVNKSECEQELSILIDASAERRVWALKVLDVSGRPGHGFFYGNNLWLGSHSQCADLSNTRQLEISYDRVKRPNSTPYDYPPFPVRFFVALVEHNSTLQHHTQLPLEYIIQLGLCCPKSCTSEELDDLLKTYLSNKYLTTQNLYNLHLNVTSLRTLEDEGMWMLKLPKTIVLIVITSLIMILTIIGTCYDVKKHNRDKNLITGHNKAIIGKSDSEVEFVETTLKPSTSTLGDILKCFSIYSNVKNLVNVDLPAGSVPVIHGLKFFGMLWVIMVHAVFYQADYLDNVPIAYRLSEDIFAQILSNSTYCVDSFLFISGFLVGYLFLKSQKNMQSSSYLRKSAEFGMMFVNRFFRLTPTYLWVILFTNVMYTYYRKTSALYSSEHNDVYCTKYWWRNVLYINNLFPRDEMCLSWSWYLSLDTQSFAVSTLLLIVSTIAFKLAAGLMVLLIVVNVLTTAYTSYSIGYIPTMDEQLRQLDAIYDLPWNRMGPYLVGVVTAYILVVKLNRKLLLKERTRIFLWIIFPMLNLWILFVLYRRNLTVEFSAVYMGISRTLWGVGLGWLLIACCTGNARALEKFLSFKGWIPLSRLTYCAYLLNPLLANMIYMGSENSFNASLASFGLSTQGVAMTTYFLAFVLSVLVESPTILLTKMVFNRILKSKSTKPDSEVSNA